MDSATDPRASVRALDQVLLLHVLHSQPAERDAAVEGDETVEQSRRDGDRRRDARDCQARGQRRFDGTDTAPWVMVLWHKPSVSNSVHSMHK